MKNKTQSLIRFSSLVACLVITTTAFSAENLLISDIDDTIKRTHIKNKDKLNIAKNAVNRKNPFIGMRELYEKFAKNNSKLIYLSAAPKNFQTFGRNFLKSNQFPQADSFIGSPLFLKTDENKADFKSNKIVSYVNDEKYQNGLIVLTGDNGEGDVQAFYDAKRELTKMVADRVYPFVHLVYAKGYTLEDGQTGFLTAGDLALQFFALKLITEKDLFQVINVVNTALKSGGKSSKKVIPKWMECKSFVENASQYNPPDVAVTPETQAAISDLKKLTKKACEHDYSQGM